MKHFQINKKWLKIALLAVLIISLSVATYYILRLLNITDINQIKTIISGCGNLKFVVFVLIFTLCSTFMCFIPGTSATFIGISIVLFGAISGFILSTISVFLSSSLMFIIGRYFGEKTVQKLVGTKSLKKAQNLVDLKSKMLLPLMFLFPIFPDDALCMVAGLTKMKYLYFAIIVALFRTVGIASICFLGSGIINWSELNLVDWFVLINVCLIDLILIFKYQNKLEKFLIKKKEPNEQANTK